ncbi:MAG: hypothetical protein RLZZ211_1244 [Bacteroidota bacterium]|jgi:hypothetical protein
MKTSFFLLFALLGSAVFAQSNLSIFNNNGQQFYVVLNGIRQNSKPETNVQVSQIKNGSYAVKVIFDDGKTPDIDKNFMIDAPYDITARIIFKKGKGKLQMIGQEPTHGVIQEAVVYRPSDAAVYSDAVVVNSISNQNAAAATQITQTLPVQTSTTTQTTGTGNATGVNMNMNVQETTTNTTVTNMNNNANPNENVNLNMNLSVGGVNLNLNANASGTGLGAGTTVSETTTTTTTSSSSTVSTSSASTTSGVGLNSNININQSGANQTVQGQTNTQVLQQQQQQQVIQNQQQGHFVNCTQTMNRLEAFKAELQDQSFEEDRLEALKLAMNKTCLSTAQAGQLLDLFTFDENRLEAAKFLSDRLTDRDNAGSLAMKLTFDSSKMEYRRYISE